MYDQGFEIIWRPKEKATKNRDGVGLHMNHHPKSLGDMYACQEDRIFGEINEKWAVDLKFTY